MIRSGFEAGLCLTLSLVSGLSAPTSSWGQVPGALTISMPWSRATPPGVTVGGAYFDVVNKGPADRLLGLSSTVARSVEMHQSLMKGAVMEMRRVESVAVPAHGELRFAPGGLHVMLLGLKAPLKEGQHFTLQMKFEHAGEIQADVTVRALADPGPAQP
jgi:copper(I)-binding protein